MELTTMNHLTWDDVHMRAAVMAQRLRETYPSTSAMKMYPVPRGGIHAAQALLTMMAGTRKPIDLTIVQLPLQADFIIDDIIDSGDTLARHEQYAVPFLSLVDKRTEADLLNQWVVMPWEKLKGEDGPQANITRLLQYLGESPDREGLKETPARVIASYNQLYGGYLQNPADVMKVFEEDTCDEMVLLRNVEFYSTCEHHMLPFFGKAHIAYLPNKTVLGVSKLARVLDIYARRLQIQERLTGQVTDALMEYLKPKGAACVVEAQHFCMVSRGVEKQNSRMVTSSLQGAFKTDPATRAEFFSMIKG